MLLCITMYNNMLVNPSRHVHFRGYIFIFVLLCGASKGFLKAFKAFIKAFEPPQRSVKIKI